MLLPTLYTYEQQLFVNLARATTVDVLINGSIDPLRVCDFWGGTLECLLTDPPSFNPVCKM